MSFLGVELGFRVHWKILGICQWLLINQSFSQVGKHLGFSRLDYLFSRNMNQELKMRVYIVGSFVFSTIYNLVFPLPVMASPVESLGCSTSKVLKDGDDITLTHLWHRERLAGGRNVPSGLGQWLRQMFPPHLLQQRNYLVEGMLVANGCLSSSHQVFF